MRNYILGTGWQQADLDRVRRALGWPANEVNYSRIAMQMRAIADKGVEGQVAYVQDSLDALDDIDTQALKIPQAPNADATADNRLIRKIDVIEYESSSESQAIFDRKINQLRNEHRQRVADTLFLRRIESGSASGFRMSRG